LRELQIKKPSRSGWLQVIFSNSFLLNGSSGSFNQSVGSSSGSGSSDAVSFSLFYSGDAI
jgi:hypothetical protein